MAGGMGDGGEEARRAGQGQGQGGLGGVASALGLGLERAPRWEPGASLRVAVCFPASLGLRPLTPAATSFPPPSSRRMERQRLGCHRNASLWVLPVGPGFLACAGARGGHTPKTWACVLTSLGSKCALGQVTV